MNRVAARRVVGDWCMALLFFAAFGLVEPAGEWLGGLLGSLAKWLFG